MVLGLAVKTTAGDSILMLQAAGASGLHVQVLRLEKKYEQ